MYVCYANTYLFIYLSIIIFIFLSLIFCPVAPSYPVSFQMS